MDQTIRNCIKKIILVLCGGIAAVFSAQYATFVMNHKTTTFELKYPFVDDENMEFLLNFLFQSIALFLGCVLYTGVEVAMTIFENFAAVTPKLIYHELAQLIEMYEQKQLTKSQLRVSFKNTLVMSLDYVRYVFVLFSFNL